MLNSDCMTSYNVYENSISTAKFINGMLVAEKDSLSSFIPGKELYNKEEVPRG